MREDWAEKLRQKLEGHRKSPPPGLWEGFCKEMGFEAEPVHKKSAVIKRWWAAAAAVLALMGFFVFHNNSDIEQPQLANAVSQQPASEKQIAEEPIAETPTSETPTTEQPAPKQLADKPISEQPVFNQLAEATCPPDFADEPEQVPSAEEKDEPIENVQTEHEELRAEQTATHTNSELKSMQGNHHYPISNLHSHPNKWSLGVNASGGLLAANTSQRMDRLYYKPSENLLDEKGYMSDMGDSYLSYTLTEYRSEHHLPIRFGVSLNYQLTPRIALHSGISYTYLFSEFSIPLYEQANYDQELHYLGIPVGISWQFWKTNHFQFYVSGGTMLEKCVHAEVDGNSVSKKPWQWSVNAAAGAEYSLIPQLGFYLEPSLGYYFNDGTSFNHYYKEHPLSPSIELGLRLHLNK